MDEVIIFSRTFYEHVDRLRDGFSRLRESNLKLKPSKCIFLYKVVEFLGHLISSEGVRPNPDKVELVESFVAPKNTKQI